MMDNIDREDHGADGLRAVCAEIRSITNAAEEPEVQDITNNARRVLPIIADEPLSTAERRAEEFARAVEIASTLTPEAEARQRVRRDPLKGSPFHPPRLSQ
jgi:hypothetical protein